MQRAFPWFLAAALAAFGLGWACQTPQVAADPPPHANAPNAPSEQPKAQAPAIPAPETFRAWPYVYARENADARLMLLCVAPSPQELEARAKEEEARSGPHAQHAIAVRVNPEAVDAYQTTQPMPVGAVVVKEKWWGFSPGGANFDIKRADLDKLPASTEYGMMIKREPGYDPAHGDWQYVYVEAGKVTEGRLPSCIQCHSQFKARDYLAVRGAKLKD
jgi:hypothetical protein